MKAFGEQRRLADVRAMVDTSPPVSADLHRSNSARTREARRKGDAPLGLRVSSALLQLLSRTLAPLLILFSRSVRVCSSGTQTAERER